MYSIGNFTNNDDVKIIAQKGGFSVIEYQRDLSVAPGTSISAYFDAKMNVKKRQVVCDMSKTNNGVICQAGAMQWTVGNVQATSGIKGASDLVGKLIRGKVTGETAVKPEYKGTGTLVLEDRKSVV